MNHKCLYCYKALDEGVDFHANCSQKFFRMTNAPKLDYDLDQMAELAKLVVKRRVTVPGVQAKLSMTVVKKARARSDYSLTVVGVLGGNYILSLLQNIIPNYRRMSI